MQINLNSEHPYKNWKIISQEIEVNSETRVYKIVFEKDQGCLLRISKLAFSILLIIGTFGLILLSERFKEYYAEAFLTKLTQEVTSSQSLENYILEKIHSCPSTQRLYFEALGELRSQSVHNSLGIQFYPINSRNFPEGSHGLAHFSTGNVDLQFGIDEDRLISTFVFELTNFKQIRRFYEIQARLHAGQFSNADDYAKESERVEYDGMQMHNRVLQEAIETNQWSHNLKIFDRALQNRWATFEDYWNSVRSGAHANYHRESFYNFVRTQPTAL